MGIEAAPPARSDARPPSTARCAPAAALLLAAAGASPVGEGVAGHA